MRAAIYARVSTFDQEPENQLQELRRYIAARGWTGQEYVDRGVSGAKDRRPALDALVSDAKRRKFDVLICWRLDRLGRNLRHLVTTLEELQQLGVVFVSLGEGKRSRPSPRRERDGTSASRTCSSQSAPSFPSGLETHCQGCPRIRWRVGSGKK